MEFITQPFGQVRLGEFLLSHLADPQWTLFRAAVAFVKRSGTRYLRQPLRDFSGRASVRISVGIDLYSTSREGLSDLLEATNEGQILVYHNNGPNTFHPKVYLFRSEQRADIIVGSGNLTGGGLFTNYEASLAVSLNLAVSEDGVFLKAAEAALDEWVQPQDGLCYVLTPGFLDQLVASGLVRSEAQLAEMQRAAASQQPPAAAPNAAGAASPDRTVVSTPALFATFPVPLPPTIPTAPALPASDIAQLEPEQEETEGVTAAAAEAVSGTPASVISVLSVDLPVPGSSNEVTITKYIRNAQPEFWGWPLLFAGPDPTTGQYRRNVRIRYGEQVIKAYLLDFPGRKPDGIKASADFRLGSIAPIVADLQQEDDLIVMSLSAEPDVDYLARVVHIVDSEHEQLMNGMQVYSRSRSTKGTYRKFRYVS
jgi:hypothetical protein